MARDALQGVRFHAPAIVAADDFDGTGIVRDLHRKIHLAAGFGDGFKGIDQQIQKHLLDLNIIHQRRVFRPGAFQREMRRDDIAEDRRSSKPLPGPAPRWKRLAALLSRAGPSSKDAR